MPGHWVHNADHEPFMTVPMRVHHEGMALKPPIPADDQNKDSYARFSAQFFVCEHTTRINGHRSATNMWGGSTEAPDSQARFPVGEGIQLAHWDMKSFRSRLRASLVGRAVVTSLLRRSAEQQGKVVSSLGPLIS
jgi:hypothetical protein